MEFFFKQFYIKLQSSYFTAAKTKGFWEHLKHVNEESKKITKYSTVLSSNFKMRLSIQTAEQY